jgi:NDP-4-keto-2,6-dideoxyhexose 3-C-methyltransferase
MKVETITQCRICKNKNLIPIINLGLHSLSGRFPKKKEPDPPIAPLILVKCNDIDNSNFCGLVQLKHTVQSEELYKHEYGYRSGINKTMITHLTKLVEEILKRVSLANNDIILDIGSNDATLLNAYPKKKGIKVGIDPTGTFFSKYYTKDISLICDFFSENSFKKYFPYKKAKIITSIAMFYDLPDPMKFTKDIKEILHPEGVWVFEQSYLPYMLKTNSFDTVCHEHLEYYSIKQIEWLLEKNKMCIVDISFNDINGGSFRITAMHKKKAIKINKVAIAKAKKDEKKNCLDSVLPYKLFKKEVKKEVKKLYKFIKKETKRGKKIYIYGASTKGNTFLQYAKLNNKDIVAAAERNTEKYGKRTPSTKIPIVSEEEARYAHPDYFLVLPWHFKKEFIKREKKFLLNGGKLIFPLPKFEIISEEKTRL